MFSLLHRRVVPLSDSMVPGPRLAQVIRRTYNSLAPIQNSVLGTQGWSLNVVQQLQQDVSTGAVTLKEGDGSAIRFARNPDGTYSSPPAVWMTLAATPGAFAWRISRRDGITYDFDTTGRMRRLSEPNGYAIDYDYDATGKLTGIRGPVARQTSLQYDGSNRISRITDAAMRSYTYAYNVAGRLQTVTGPLDLSYTYAYDTAGRITSITDAGDRAVLLSYDALGRLSSYGWKDVSGNTTFTYNTDASGTRTTITDALGYASIMTTNPAGNMVERRDAKGGITRQEFDDGQRLVRVINPRGLVSDIRYAGVTPSPRVFQVIRHAAEDIITTFEDYQAYDKPSRVTDSTGMKTIITYDSAGNVLTTTTGLKDKADGTGLDYTLAATTTYAYNSGMLVRIDDALGNRTTYEVDALGQIKAVVNPLGGRTVMEYDAAGNLSVVIDPNGYVSTHTYDAYGRPLNTVFPDYGIATWSYDRSGLLMEEVRPGGTRISYAYDPGGRLVAQSDPLGNTTRLTYDAAGNQVLTFYPNGSLIRREYDAIGQVIRAYDGENLTNTGVPIPAAKFVETEYDVVGNLSSVMLPNGYKITADYDLLNQLTKVTQPPSTTTYSYDKLGRTIGVRDGNGKWTRYEYDLPGRLARVYDASNVTALGEVKSNATYTAYEFDLLGRRVKVTDPLGASSRYEYNPLGQVVREIDPLGQMILYSYDRSGRMLEKLDRNANNTSYEYDAMGRTVRINYHDDCDGVRFIYDTGGRRVAMVDPLGTTTYQYDAVGRLIQEASPTGKLSYEYDAIGQRTALHLAGGSIRYQFDRANRLAKVTDVTGAATSFRYGATGELLEASLPGGVTQTNTYDPLSNRVKDRTYTGPTGTKLSYNYDYDTVGNVTSVRRLDQWEGRNDTISYEYDDLYRLLYVYNMGGIYTGYTYDGHGNRVKEVLGNYAPGAGNTFIRYGSNSQTTYEYSLAGWLTRKTQTWFGVNPVDPSVTQYAYDGEGNMLQSFGAEKVRYNYDSRGLIVKAQLGGEYSYNEYDGDGRRTQRRVVTVNPNYPDTTSKSSRYQYDGVHVIAELDGAGGLRTAYSRTPDGRLLSWYKPKQGAVNENSGALLVDHLGSVVKLIQASNGLAVNHYDYDAFGKVTGLREGVGNDMKFTGAVLDSSGLYHLSSRFYNPQIGRFITQDTWKGSAWTPWTQNLYSYVGNNPVNFVDPTGHSAQCAHCVTSEGGGGGGGIGHHVIFFAGMSAGQNDPLGLAYLRQLELAGFSVGTLDYWSLYPGCDGVCKADVQLSEWAGMKTGLSAEVAAQLAGQIQELQAGGKKVIFIGHSMGGTIASNAALALAEAGVNVDGLVLLGGAVTLDTKERVGGAGTSMSQWNNPCDNVPSYAATATFNPITLAGLLASAANANCHQMPGYYSAPFMSNSVDAVLQLTRE